ncbi:hypothetical protein NPIL_561511 [Nephila pilipes]|uniref:Mos1 transposase HTH domain-containing protein n=1 Tax=Nephila pilipes TaxID=299642 RepID=A0A8X6QQX6_NEPPI|nr:hypothetical protein NPIL_561511 [Nephila pilipes]
MVTKGDQRSRNKIESSHGRNASECYHGLCEACGDNMLPYRTVARWVEAFHSGTRFPDVIPVLRAVECSVAFVNKQHFTNGIPHLPDFWKKVRNFAGD